MTDKNIKVTFGDEGHDVFNNPMVEAALKALSPADLLKYKIIGEELYGNVNFEDSKILNTMPVPMEECVYYVSQQLKSGLHPSMMDDNEKNIMKEAYGDKWYERWGYIEKDLTEIATFKV
jgi:hypothetical protein